MLSPRGSRRLLNSPGYFTPTRLDTNAFGCRPLGCVKNTPTFESACQLNRSTQHFLEVYSQESEILKSFLGVDLGAAPLCPDPLAYSQTGRFS